MLLVRAASASEVAGILHVTIAAAAVAAAPATIAVALAAAATAAAPAAECVHLLIPAAAAPLCLAIAGLFLASVVAGLGGLHVLPFAAAASAATGPFVADAAPQPAAPPAATSGATDPFAAAALQPADAPAVAPAAATAAAAAATWHFVVAVPRPATALAAESPASLVSLPATPDHSPATLASSPAVLAPSPVGCSSDSALAVSPMWKIEVAKHAAPCCGEGSCGHPVPGDGDELTQSPQVAQVAQVDQHAVGGTTASALDCLVVVDGLVAAALAVSAGQGAPTVGLVAAAAWLSVALPLRLPLQR